MSEPDPEVRAELERAVAELEEVTRRIEAGAGEELRELAERALLLTARVAEVLARSLREGERR